MFIVSVYVDYWLKRQGGGGGGGGGRGGGGLRGLFIMSRVSW